MRRKVLTHGRNILYADNIRTMILLNVTKLVKKHAKAVLFCDNFFLFSSSCNNFFADLCLVKNGNFE